jgi:excinuclease UvrABC nuclease subunit
MPNKIKKSDWKKEDIINAIIQMRTEKMATTKTILDFLMDDIGYGQAYAYILIKESREKIAEIYDRNNNSRIEESIAQLENMMEKAYLNKDYKLSYNIRQEINKLVGLYAAQKVELSGEIFLAKFPGMDENEK